MLGSGLRQAKLTYFQGLLAQYRGVCTPVKPTLATMKTTRRYAYRRPIPPHKPYRRRPNPVRELITKAPIGTPSIFPTITNTLTCQKCGTFEKTGRVSCCAPGGAWYKKCGGAGNRNVEHRWFEGVETCEA